MSIKVNNVSFTYLDKTPNAVKALDDVSFTIRSGIVTSIIGHTGSGKSTLIQMFNALLLPKEGTIEVDNFVIGKKGLKSKELKALRKHVSTVFQFPEYQLFEETVEKDVAFGLKNFGVTEEKAIKQGREALKLVGIDESFYKRSPFELSGGEKRRVAIAGILVLKPDVLVLDEPTAGLDPQGTKIVTEVIKKLKSEGKTVIVITHDMKFLLSLTDEVIVMENGKNIYQGDVKGLFAIDQEKISFEIPILYQFAQKLIKNGIKIDIKNVYDEVSLIEEIKRNGQ